MQYRRYRLILLFLLAACQRHQPQPHTLIITPCTQEGAPLTGSIALWRYTEENFLLPQEVIPCDPDDTDDELAEEQEPPCYELYVSPGRYRITAHDAEQQCEYHQELEITPQSPRWIHLDIGPDCCELMASTP